MTENGPGAGFALSITKAEINELPLFRFEGPIHVVDNDASARQAIKKLKKEKVLGFDTESRPAFKKGDRFLPSLVQFATREEAYLFQISKFEGIDGLAALFEKKKPLKVGVALHDDIRRLKEIAPFEDKGFFEIAELTRQLDITNTGLRSLAGILLGHRISKSAQVSNWAKSKLTASQLVYAATDAWVSLLLYERAMELVKAQG